MTAFAMPFVAAPADIDDLGHVSNVVYVRWLLEIAIAHSNHVGWELSAYQREGAVFVVKRHEIDYGFGVKSGQVLAAKTWVTDIKGVSCIRNSSFTLEDGKVALAARTTWVFMNLGSGKPQRIPEVIKTVFGATAS